MSLKVTTPLIGQGLNTSPNSELSKTRVGRCFVSILDRGPKIDSVCQKSTRVTLRVIVIGCSAAVKVFFIPVSLELPAGGAFAAGNCIAYFALEYWSGNAVINSIAGPKTRAEMELERYGNKYGRGRAIAIGVSSVTIGLLSQVTYALAAALYNSQKFKVLAGVTTLIAGGLFPARSTQLSLEAYFNNQKLSEIEKTLVEIKNDLIAHLQDHRTLLVEAGYEEQCEIINKFNEFRKSSNKVVDFTNHVFAKRALPPTSPPSCSPTRAFSYVVGGSLTVILQSCIGWYTWSKTQELVTDDTAVAGVCTALAVGSAFYMTGKSLISTTERICNAIVDFAECRFKPTLIEKLRPKTTFCLKTLSLLSSTLALGATWVIWSDFFEDNKMEKNFFTSTINAATFLLLYTATLDMVDDIVEALIKQTGTHEEKEVLELYHELRNFQEVIQKSSMADFGIFLTKLPDSVRIPLLQRHNLAVENLENYLNPNKSRNLIEYTEIE